MFASAKRSTVRSTMSSSRAIQAKKNESFFAYIYRKMKEMLMGLWGYSRKFLWVSTTGKLPLIQDSSSSSSPSPSPTSWKCKKSSSKYREVLIAIFSGRKVQHDVSASVLNKLTFYYIINLSPPYPLLTQLPPAS